MRGRSPAIERAARVWIVARSLDPHEELPGPVGFPELLDRPGRTERRRMFRQAHMNVVRQRWAAWAAGYMLGLPTEHILHKGPGIVQRGLALILCDVLGDL